MARQVVLVLAAALVLAVAAAPVAADGGEGELGETRVFAEVGEPGFPEGIAVLGDRVYVGTHGFVRESDEPSRIFGYDRDSGALVDEIVIEGQDLDEDHGLLGMAARGDALYVADSHPPRVLRVHPGSGRQETVVEIPELPQCPLTDRLLGEEGQAEPCKPVTADHGALPDDVAFDQHGNLYVTDLFQATIFRVRPGGDEAEIWYQDPALDAPGGANGIELSADGEALLVAHTVSAPSPELPGAGYIHRIPIVEAPTPADREVFHEYLDPGSPDGLAVGRSGRVYVALFATNEISVLEPDGTEHARFPSPAENLADELDPDGVPYDAPASITFDGKGSILVTNQSVARQEPDHWAVLEAWVDDVAVDGTIRAVTRPGS